ncbi:MAG: helix-turn-helix domain-containing protein [Candidatus Omnitrophota bacterium]
MAEEKLLTIRDVAVALGVSEKEVIDLAESGKIPAYKIGGIYLRFKKEQIDELRKSLTSLKQRQPVDSKYIFKDKLNDFVYFNDFYILCAVLIALLLTIILKGY